MSTTLRDFIASRKSEIRDQLKALKIELKELLVAETALEGQDVAPTPASSGPTIKDMARFVLGTNTAKDGLTSSEILAYIKTEFDREIDRTSLSPQLSRLKDAGEVALEGEKWFSKAHWDAMRRAVDASLADLIDDFPPNPEFEEDDMPPF